MASRSEKRKAQLIDQVAEDVSKRVSGQDAKLAEKFTRALYEHVPPDDILGETAENLAGAASAGWAFMRERRTDEPKIRVYNPEPARDGWMSPHTVVQIVNDDMPFLVDSIAIAANREGAEVLLVIHPIFGVERDDKGRLTALGATDEFELGVRSESFMLVYISEQPESRHKVLEGLLSGVLADVRAAVDDWRPMRQRCREIIRELEKAPPKLPREEVAEGVAFLEWLDDEHFTYLGYREYHFEGKGAKSVARILPESGLGILRDSDFSVFDGLRNVGKLPPDVQAWLKTPELLRITKANRRSTVHRPAHLDTIAVKLFSHHGEVVGERLFVGLFTSSAYSRSPRVIPLLRRKIDNIIARAGFVPGSHDGKALLHILETYPRDELFQAGEAELVEIAIGILNLQERQRTALFVRRDPFERFVSCMVFVPRDRFDTALRLKLQALLAEAYNGTVSAFSTQVGDAPLARLHVIIKTEQGKVPAVDTGELEAQLAAAARSWADRLDSALTEELGERRGTELSRRYAAAFPSNYREAFVPKDAVADIRKIEEALESGQVALDLYRPYRAPDEVVHFKVYVAGAPVPLSDVIPVLEHMGLKVIGEVPYEVRPAGSAQPVWVHDFDMVRRAGGALDLEAVREAFHEVFAEVWSGEMEDDGFNGLVLSAGLTAQEIRVLRAYCKYLRQAQIPFSQEYMEETLSGNAAITAELAELFMLRFDPDRQKAEGKKKARAAVEAQEAKIVGLLETVANLDEDRIIRRYLNLIQATLRTNYFQAERGNRPKSCIAFKFAAREIDDLPAPRPFREIFVYSPRVEGVHLRFGLVARGGLRWSDRREDFRTEVLGLVKAQQVKNAVIVPVGSKGGFVPKRLPPPEAGRDAWLAEGVEAYRIFLRAMLDITDNLKGGRLVAPRRVVRYDGDDPYLVVAADKGTATFSDYANAISGEYGFWLDDAFASGGSAGYDHKAMGITARGAWESVKRHFRELGKNVQEEDFTAIGVGDMSGDVFGNGMLMSKHTRLLGAFNHLHIFVDPDPDAEASWAERKRLFDTPRSTWADYDAKLISKGGGVFERRAKSIKISAQMKAAFGIDKDAMTPAELIQALLRAPAELLWFGGIGTYVKAREESHAEVGDRSNDAVRIDGRELRVRVVGEGANLGMTQRGRIEYALAGGRLNTDAIDNSGGVDCSDHEVNIKVLLGTAEQAGTLTREDRNRLLEGMTEEVAALVLRDNYLQTQSISVTHQVSAHLVDRLGRFMHTLERAGKLDRALEFLPDDETMTERLNAGTGLTRPELAVLLAYAKIALYDALLDSDLPDDPFLEDELVRYFPAPLHAPYAAEISTHRLRREIVATQLTNGVVNRMGLAFVHELTEKTGLPPADVVRAYIAAREIVGLRELWAGIEALDNKVPAGTQAEMLIECGRIGERLTTWLLRNEKMPLDIGAAIAGYREGVGEIAAALGELMPAGETQRLAEETARLSHAGVPAELARRIAGLKRLAPACDVVRLARQTELPVRAAAGIYVDVGARFGFDWLRRAAGRLPSDTAWDKLAVGAIVDDLYGYQYQLAGSVLDSGEASSAGKRAIDAWIAERRNQVARTDHLLAELQALATPDLAQLAVANRQLKSLVGA